jgi:outer membrane biosynthesis protein TonB
MKTGLATSLVMHAALLGFGLLSLSAPSAFEVADVESLPVDIIPVESITQIQKGDKRAPVNEKPAPLPTERPDTVADAREIGDNDEDTAAPPTPQPKPKPVEAATAPAPSPKPEPKPADEPKPEAADEPEPAQAPATEVAPAPTPKQAVEPDPVTEAIAAAEANADAVELPDVAPTPQARPERPKAQTAKAPDHKEAEKPVREAAAKPKSEEKEFDPGEIAALLNKEKPSGGGAKRSTETASLGGDKPTGGEKLTQSEMDALRGQVQRCWNVPAGALDAENLRVSIQFKLDRTGALEGAAEIISNVGGSTIERAAAESARRAVIQCAPYNLPVDKYDAWADVIVNFDPSDMF